MNWYFSTAAIVGSGLSMINSFNMSRSPVFNKYDPLYLTGFCFVKGTSYGLVWPISLPKMAIDAYESSDKLTQHIVPYYHLNEQN